MYILWHTINAKNKIYNVVELEWFPVSNIADIKKQEFEVKKKTVPIYDRIVLYEYNREIQRD